ncbi:MAG TPA: hypothetical protein VLG67_01670 [Candidatus Saccharimonadales bacterium]|nr:hypothetical protein [Candidatus Saccharimonadales bacterium]
MKINLFQKICVIYLLILFVFWDLLFLGGSKTGFFNFLYSFLFGLIPLIGGFIAILKSKVWGRFKSSIGKAVFFVGLGLFLWGFGETIWSYYNFFKGVAAPYPSIADIGFAPSIFFYGLGAFYISKATGAKYGLRNLYAKVFVTITPILILLVSYYFLVIIARGGVLVPAGEGMLRTVLDIAYPVGDFLALTISIIVSGLSFKYFGGKYKMDIFSILVGLGVMFIGDLVFSYTTNPQVNIYYNGNFGDLILTVGLFLLTFGILGFCSIPKLADEKMSNK